MKNNPWKSGIKFLLIAIITLLFLTLIFSCDVNHYNSKGFREQRPFVEKPQLKSSVTMGAYADNIKELNDAIYQTDLDIRATVKTIRWNYMTPWCITSLMPNPPAHLAKYVNQ